LVPETMTQEQVSKALGVEVSTLAVWRSTGKGPRFIKSGTKVMYLAADINDYIDQNRIKP
jgi:predicted site-specific integrase-resolvase